MIRRQRPYPSRHGESALTDLNTWRVGLISRRRLLLAAAGGSLALMFGRIAAAEPVAHDPWPTLDAVLDHLLPSEADSPGAREIRALDYLRFVVDDRWIARDERDFIVHGAGWLDDLAIEHNGNAFTSLDSANKERLLRQIAQGPAGENWIATLLSYLFEALLSAPAYGGNPEGIGWRWLEYVPGFPLPRAGNRYPELPL